MGRKKLAFPKLFTVFKEIRLFFRRNHAASKESDPDIEEPSLYPEEPFPVLGRTRSLFKKCCEKHETVCGKDRATSIKLSLIDCKTRYIVSGRSHIKYAALSYVWGTSEIIPSRHDAVGLSLPSEAALVIEDAIKAALYLGLKYLWVDQYCVEQIDKKKKAQQIRQMHRIYNDAEVTLVAAVGSDAHSGLAAPCLPSELITEYSRNGAAEAETDKDMWDPNSGLQRSLRQIEKSVWNTRGWTYQESFVSRRVIVFHQYGVYFECATTAAESIESTEVSELLDASDGWWTDQGIPNGPRARYLSTYINADMMTWLAHLITEYSQRSLKYQSDTINAFSAVLQDFDGRQSIPFANCDDDMGTAYSLLDLNSESLWRISIVHGVPFYTGEIDPSKISSARMNSAGLCWHYGNCSGSGNGSARKPEFPSWSWAGWTGPIEWKLPQSWSSETILHVTNITFVEASRNFQRELTFEEAKEAQSPLLSFYSVAIPPRSFFEADSGRQSDNGICLHNYILSWPKRGFLCHSDCSKTSRLTLLKGLQEGTCRLVLLYVHLSYDIMGFQGWILQRCETENPCYKRVGSVYHEMNRETKLAKCLKKFAEDAEYERFEIC